MQLPAKIKVGGKRTRGGGEVLSKRRAAVPSRAQHRHCYPKTPSLLRMRVHVLLLMNCVAVEICKAFVCVPPGRLIARNHISVPTSKLRQFLSVGDPFIHATTHRACNTCCLSRLNGDASGTTSIVSDSEEKLEEGDSKQTRKERLHHHLHELGIDADLLEDAALRSVTTTGNFGSY
jgi:hypothetical protein